MQETSLGKIGGGSVPVENPQEIFDRLMQTMVSETLIADAIDAYATLEIKDETEREDFIEKYSDDTYTPIIKKAVLEVVVVVVAACTVEFDSTFRAIAGMIESEDTEQVIRRMKRLMLERMVEAATNDMGLASQEEIFRRRLTMVEVEAVI